MEEKPKDTPENKTSADTTGDSPFQVQGPIRPRQTPEKKEKEEGEILDNAAAARKRIKTPRKEVFKPQLSSDAEGIWEKEDRVEPSEEVAPIAEENFKRHHQDPTPGPPTGRALLRSAARALWQAKLRMVPALLVALVGGLWIGQASHDGGVAEGRRLAAQESRREFVPMPPAIADQVRKAMIDLRSGHFADAQAALQKLEQITPSYPSLTYLVASAALQHGDLDLAEQKATESIAKNERVSDSLALRAVIATQRGAGHFNMGDPVVRSEELLRASLAADPANPYAHFELANILRFQQKRKDAMDEIQAAQAFLNPMDSHLVMEITASILALEDAPLDSLSREIPSGNDPRKIFPAAYAAMRQQDFHRAALLLHACESTLSPDVFDYLVNDPALRRYSTEAELEQFYRN